MPGFMPMATPYVAATEWLVHVGCKRTKLEMMVHEKEFTVLELSDACYFIRSDARQQAIHYLYGREMSAGGVRNMSSDEIRNIYPELGKVIPELNPYRIKAERDEWERTFREEVDMRVRDMFAEKGAA